MFGPTRISAAAATPPPSRVLPPPTFHDLGWSSRLLVRDVKEMFKGKGSRISQKVKKVFGIRSTVPPTPESAHNPDCDSTEDTASPPKDRTSKVPKYIKKHSTITTGNTMKRHDVSSDPRPDSGDTYITAPEDGAVPEMPQFEIPHDLKIKSFYQLLSDKSWHWYKTRPFAPPHKERWLTRGIFLFLTIAIELSEFNPSLDKFRVGKKAPDQNAFLHQIIQLGTSPGGHKMLLALGLNPRLKSSPPPRDIYSAPGANDLRIDSAHSTISPTVWSAGRDQEGAQGKIPPSPAELWAAILVALTFRETSANIAGSLFHHIRPEEDPNEFFIRIGDPAQRLREGEDDELREQLWPLLFPDYLEVFKQTYHMGSLIRVSE